MKSILLTMLLIVSSTGFAAPRLPFYKETLSIDSALEGNSSIKKIIDAIEEGVIDPMYGVGYNSKNEFGVFKTPGSSRMVTRLMGRFSLDKPIGEEAENLKLLELLVERGLLVNEKYYKNGIDETDGNTMMDFASKECTTSAINFLYSKGASITQEEFYWRRAYTKGFDYEAGSPNDLKCQELALFFFKPIQKITLERAYYFLTGTFHVYGNDFTGGGFLDLALSSELKEEVKKKFGIVLSKRPASNAPSDEFYTKLNSAFSQPNVANDLYGPDYYENWWGKYTDDEKAWACYVSTFDEMYHVLIGLGVKHEDIVTKRILSPDYGPVHGNFAANIFTPYCDSIRN